MVYARHKDPLFRFCKRQLNNHSLAEEIFQDIWSRVINANYQSQSTASFKTYLYTIARNRIIDSHRQNKMELIEFDENAFENSRDTNENYPDILKLVTRLPDEQKEVFLLKAELDMSFTEIAEVCNCKAETAKSRYRYAVQKLTSLLESAP